MDENHIEIFQRGNGDRTRETVHPRTRSNDFTQRSSLMPEYEDIQGVIENPFPLGSTSRGKVYAKNNMFGEILYENQYYPEQIKLLAKKRLFCFEIYNIGCGNNKYIGSLKSNISGSHYNFYTNNKSQIEIKYRTSWVKLKKPRSFHVIFNNEDKNPLILLNKEPYFNLEANSYSLNFNGRVTTPSVKNFQLIHPTDPTYIALTFGKVSKNTYILDHTFPLSTIQGFVVALAAIDRKMWCD